MSNLRAVICAAVGVILATAGVSVTSHWQAWAIIALTAINGVIPHTQGKPK